MIQQPNPFIVSYDTVQEIIRFRYEVLLDTHEALLEKGTPLTKSFISSANPSEIHYYLEYHQKMLINALYFRDKNLFLEYIEWFYNVNYHKKIDLDIFLEQIELWRNAYHNYLSHHSFYEINAIYDFLIESHQSLVKNIQGLSFNTQNPLVDRIYNLAIESKKNAVLELVQKECSTLDEFISFFNGQLSYVMEKVGFMWESSQISVAKEHIASRIIEEVSLSILDSFPTQKRKNQTILLTNAPNEFHGMGLKIISKILEKTGYQTVNIGSSGSPAKDIIRAIEDFKPNFIVFGISLSINLYDVAEIIKELLKSTVNKDFEIIVGGTAFKFFSSSEEKRLNSDYYSNNIKDFLEYLDRKQSN